MLALSPITDGASYRRASARASELMNNCADDAERAELRALGKALTAYAETHFDIYQLETDGVDELAYMLDAGLATVGELVEVLGGMERLIEYMTRRRDLDGGEIDALVAAFDVTREALEVPFCERPGWDEIAIPPVDACGDETCCRPGRRDWREELVEFAGMVAAGEDLGVATSLAR